MRHKIIHKSWLLAIFLCFFGLARPVFAQNASNDVFRSTSYPLPRFVSLGSGEVNVRTGPGRRFPVSWVFRQQGLPVEIILEYEHWRKIKDHEGAQGWVHGSLLSGRRTGLIKSVGLVDMYRKPKNESLVRARLEPGVLVQFEGCDGRWCEIEVQSHSGYVLRKYLWGVYEGENFD